MSLQANPYDTWEATDSALAALRRLVIVLCDRKPSNTAPKAEIKAWEAEMTETRAWAVQIHERRINLNLQALKAYRSKASE